jgi:hypothetical protein
MKTTSNRICILSQVTYLKSTTATQQSNDVRVYLCLHRTIIFAVIDFFV